MALDYGLDAAQIQYIRQGETDGARVDYTAYLRSGETISNVSAVAITGTSTGATASSIAASTAALTILGQTVSIASAVTFNIAVGSTASIGFYEALITTTTSDSRIGKRKIGFSVVT